MGRVQWLAKWFLERASSSAFSWDEVAAGSYRQIHINSKRAYRGAGPQSSEATTYARPIFEGVLFLWGLHHRVALVVTNG